MHLEINVSKNLKRKAKASDVITSLAFLVLFVTTYYQLFTQLDEKLNQYVYLLTQEDSTTVIIPEKTNSEDRIIKITATPISITIPDIDVENLDIVPGGIINNEWLLFNDKATYLQTSGLLGEGYNTIIYAHKRLNLFANIQELELGDRVEISGDNGKDYIYEVYEKEIINLTEVNKLKSTEPNVITLFTCDGPLDQERLIIRASLVIEES